MTSRGWADAGSLVREHHVPLRTQLAAGLEAAIRDGHLRPDARLPSTRDMAARLGVHRSTVNAAYARLRRAGWVVGGPGGRMRVRPPGSGPGRYGGGAREVADAPTPRPCAYALAIEGLRAVLAESRRAGVPRDRVIASLATALQAVAGPAREAEAPLLLAEPRPGLRAALRAELSRRLGVVVHAGPHPRRLLAGGCAGPILVRAGLEARVVAGGREVIPFHLAGGTRERGIARRAVRSGLVTLVSTSRAIREYAAELAARELGRGISFAAIPPTDVPSVVRAVAASRLVLFDEASRRSLPPTRVPTVAIRLLGDTWIASIRTYLGLLDRRPGRRPGT